MSVKYDTILLPRCHFDFLDTSIPQSYLKPQSVEVKIAKKAIFSCSGWLFALYWLICAHNAPFTPSGGIDDSPSKTFGSSVAGVV